MLARRAGALALTTSRGWLPHFGMPTARPFGAVADAYQAQVGTGKLLADEAQASAVQKFDALATALQRIPAPAPSAEPSSSSGGNGEGWLSRLGFSSARKPEPRAAARSSSAPRGLYLWGGTGSGKTALMDLFYDTLPVPPSAKMRVHFHSFMQKVHGQLHSDRAAGKHKDDPLGAVARRWAEGVKVLCLDELFVTDVGDAMIMARLFDQFVAHGVIIVATVSGQPIVMPHSTRGHQQPLAAVRTLAQAQHASHAHPLPRSPRTMHVHRAIVLLMTCISMA